MTGLRCPQTFFEAPLDLRVAIITVCSLHHRRLLFVEGNRFRPTKSALSINQVFISPPIKYDLFHFLHSVDERRLIFHPSRHEVAPRRISNPFFLRRRSTDEKSSYQTNDRVELQARHLRLRVCVPNRGTLHKNFPASTACHRLTSLQATLLSSSLFSRPRLE